MLSVRGIYENEQVKLLERLPYKKRMNVIVTVLEEVKIKKPRPIGLAKGRFEVSPHFFDELPDDLLNAFEEIYENPSGHLYLLMDCIGCAGTHRSGKDSFF